METHVIISRGLVRIDELLELSERHVPEGRRTHLPQQQRWDAIEEVEIAQMFFERDVHNEAAQWWGEMLLRMVMEYLLDNGRFRRDDFEAARAMLLQARCGSRRVDSYGRVHRANR